ncbi:uncharacterized protein LOC144031942 isoform X1 [Festucalex cinctus]
MNGVTTDRWFKKELRRKRRTEALTCDLLAPTTHISPSSVLQLDIILPLRQDQAQPYALASSSKLRDEQTSGALGRQVSPLLKDERGPPSLYLSAHSREVSTCSMSMLFLILCKTGVKRKLQMLPGKMVNSVYSDEERGSQDKESKEETILAMLGIIGTVLNLLVIIFVYIYTTL